MSMMNTSFPSMSSGEHTETSERLSDIIIPPSNRYQSPSNYLHPNPHPVKRESPSTRLPQEHDSGLVVDRDSDHFSRQTSQTSASAYPSENHFLPPILDTEGMPSKRRPESLAVRGHEYEELPTSRQQGLDYSASGDQFSQQAPPLFTKLNSVTGSNDHLLLNTAPPLPVYRKRQNPLYESNDHDEVDEEIDPVSKKLSSRQSCICLCPCLFMITVLTLVSLCLSLYVFTRIIWPTDPPRTAMVISPHNHSMQDMMDYVQLLQKENSLLEEKVKALEVLVEKLEINDSSQLAMLEKMKENLDGHQVNTDTRFTQLSTHVQNISKMHGPQGPSGSGNLSQCVHSMKSHGTSVFDSYTETGPVPTNLSQHMDSIILGVECTTEGGQSALLRVLDDHPYSQYMCRCSGVEDGANSRQCEMHYWSCPKIS